MKNLLIFTLVFCSFICRAQKNHVITYQGKTGLISLSFKDRYATIVVKNDSLVKEAFQELKVFMKEISRINIVSRIYPLFIVSPDNRYYTYPLNRNKLLRKEFRASL